MTNDHHDMPLSHPLDLCYTLATPGAGRFLSA